MMYNLSLKKTSISPTTRGKLLGYASNPPREGLSHGRASSTVDAALPFVKATYVLEDGPLVLIRLIFVVKIFSYAENVRNNFTQNFCYQKYFLDKYLTCARTYAVHAVFVALRILEGYGCTHVSIST